MNKIIIPFPRLGVLPKTGQTTSYYASDDGATERGWFKGRTVANNRTRFKRYSSAIYVLTGISIGWYTYSGLYNGKPSFTRESGSWHLWYGIGDGVTLPPIPYWFISASKGTMGAGGWAKSYTGTHEDYLGDYGAYGEQEGTPTVRSGLIRDYATRLMWCFISEPIITGQNFQTRINSVNSAARGGYSDWFCPNIMELLTLVNYGGTSPLDYSDFSLSAAYCWSCTTDPGNSDNMMCVHFGSGGIAPIYAQDDEGDSYGVIACRYF